MVNENRTALKKPRYSLHRSSAGDTIFKVFNYAVFVLVIFITAYPFLYVLFKSMSSYGVSADGVKHVNFDFGAYQYILQEKDIYGAFLLTIFVVIVSTALHIFVTMLAAYPLTKKKLIGRNVFLIYILITMLFGGGLVPYYVLIRDLGLRNSVLVYIIPGLVSGFNIIIVKNFLYSIPASLEEAARIDGASYFDVIFRIYFPLSKPIISTIGLWFAVGKWNDWFTGMLYISKQNLYLIQNVLQSMLVNNTGMTNAMGFGNSAKYMLMDNVKMAVVIVATVPIICVYPFVQKNFIKGILLGSVKE